MGAVLSEGEVERPDGRVVAWAEWGVPGGEPVLRLHGTPGSRLTRPLVPDLYERLGAHVVTVDRPGYGRSTPQRDHTWLSCADDAIAVVDAMGWETFRVIGGSGGAPHALAVGVRAPDRIRALAISNPAVPPELEDFDDLLEINAEVKRRADEGRESLEAFMAPYAEKFLADAAGTLEEIIVDAPESDREAIQDRERRAIFVEAVTEALANGPLGWYDDAWSLSQAWGFELEDVTVPVHVCYSEHDRNSPPRPVELMAARLTLASMECVPGGHLSEAAVVEREWRTLLGA